MVPDTWYASGSAVAETGAFNRISSATLALPISSRQRPGRGRRSTRRHRPARAFLTLRALVQFGDATAGREHAHHTCGDISAQPSSSSRIGTVEPRGHGPYGFGVTLTAATATVVATERRRRNCRPQCLRRPPQGRAAHRRRCNDRRADPQPGRGADRNPPPARAHRRAGGQRRHHVRHPGTTHAGRAGHHHAQHPAQRTAAWRASRSQCAPIGSTSATASTHP